MSLGSNLFSSPTALHLTFNAVGTIGVTCKDHVVTERKTLWNLLDSDETDGTARPLNRIDIIVTERSAVY